MFGQYKRIQGMFEGVLTGKGLTWGGSLVRTQATGYGLIYILDAMLKDHNMDIAGKTVVVSGSGNVAIYATEKAQQLGAKVVAMSDSNGYVYDPEGIKLDLVKNKVRGKETIISMDDSRVKLLLIPTNEELAIARETKRLVEA